LRRAAASWRRTAERFEKGAWMADVNRGNRPLSPHLTIYRPQWGSTTSILTRITGNALLISTLLVVWWFIALAIGPEAHARASGVMTSWFGLLVMTVSLWGLWYHMLAGIRHLIWDTGRMLDLPQAEMLSKLIVGLSLVLTVGTVLILWGL
jgi:succinate dehydrogenase / fumarate reductase, cytochrome b subunit